MKTKTRTMKILGIAIVAATIVISLLAIFQ